MRYGRPWNLVRCSTRNNESLRFWERSDSPEDLKFSFRKMFCRKIRPPFWIERCIFAQSTDQYNDWVYCWLSRIVRSKTDYFFLCTRAYNHNKYWGSTQWKCPGDLESLRVKNWITNGKRFLSVGVNDCQNGMVYAFTYEQKYHRISRL